MITREKYGPWALIAGGSEGMAVAYAHTLAKAGINLVLIARKPEPLDALAREVRAATAVEIRTLSLDLARPDMFERVRAVTDDVDVGMLIYNAGDAKKGKPFVKQSLDEAMQPIQLNAVGPAVLAHHFGVKMAARGRGGIILASSLAANAGIANIATYCGAKAFAQLFAEALWMELKPHGVDVLVLVPPATDTPARTRSGHGDSGVSQLASAEEIGREALANLGNGPVYVPAAGVDMFNAFRTTPRREMVERLGKSVSVQD